MLSLFLFVIIVFVVYLLIKSRSNLSKLTQEFEQFKVRASQQVKTEREQAVKSSRSVLKGQISEQLAPFLPGFNYQSSDCLFIGKLFDILCLNGLSNGDIQEVIFIDIKTGNASLNANQRMLKKAIEQNKVRFEKINIDTLLK